MTSSSPYNDWQNATTNRYFDCCKPSCAWSGKAYVVAPVQTCGIDGFTVLDNNTRSSCSGSIPSSSDGFGCINHQPWNVSSSLSYGFAAAAITVGHSDVEDACHWKHCFPSFQGQNESLWCCACYSLIFTTGSIAGKEMIVQVTNTNSYSGNLFTFQIPGAGWGSSPNITCDIQFNVTNVWGQQYGGVSNRPQCDFLPSSIRSGCYWRFDWFDNAINPDARFKEVPCPPALTNRTGCLRIWIRTLVSRHVLCESLNKLMIHSDDSEMKSYVMIMMSHWCAIRFWRRNTPMTSNDNYRGTSSSALPSNRKRRNKKRREEKNQQNHACGGNESIKLTFN